MRVFSGVSELVDAVSGGVQVRPATTIEAAGSAKPACAVESIVRYVA
jgi:hypothetical protein